MMMTVESLYDWLTEKRTEVAQKKEYLNLRLLVIPQFVCDDDTSISIQASHFHYCDKKQDENDIATQLLMLVFIPHLKLACLLMIVKRIN